LKLQGSTTKYPETPIIFSVDKYEFNNRHVNQLKVYLEKHLKDDCYASLIHGSAGTNELIDYSDLDALIILKDEVFNDHKKLTYVAYHLFVSRKFMHELDPLQHHGWFVIPESYLKNFNSSIIPISLIRSSKLLTGNSKFSISLKKKNPTYKLHSILKNLEKRINNKNTPDNMFSLKSMLSEFMLTPSLYLQERYNNDVNKSDSFEIASKDFDPKVYSIMNEVSDIRLKWRYNPGSLRSYLLKKLRMLPGGSIAFLSGRTTVELRNVIDHKFLNRMKDLVNNMVVLLDNQKEQH